MTRLAKTLLAVAAAALLALPAGAQAKHGADDPAGHVRQAAHQTAASTSSAAAHKSRHRHRGRHGRRNARRADDSAVRGGGADDATTERRGRGTDDGPNHT